MPRRESQLTDPLNPFVQVRNFKRCRLHELPAINIADIARDYQEEILSHLSMLIEVLISPIRSGRVTRLLQLRRFKVCKLVQSPIRSGRDTRRLQSLPSTPSYLRRYNHWVTLREPSLI